MRREHPLQLLDDERGIGQAALALVTARELAFGRLDNGDAARFQLREILRDRRMRVHMHIHRGRKCDRRLRREQHSCDDIIGDSGRGLGDDVGGRGSDHDRIGAIG